VNGTSEKLHGGGGWARQVSAELGSVVLDTLGLPAAIAWQVRQFQKSTGEHYELTASGAAGDDLPGGRATTIFDVYAEVLSNMARDAGASRVAIALTMTPQEATLVVRDNGVAPGAEGAAAAPCGTATIRARSSQQKGLGEVAAACDAGNTVTLGPPPASAR
jgi:signal transduction histidine kinase